MDKKFLVISAIIVIIFAVILGTYSEKEKEEYVFHVTLADSNQYHGGVFSERFLIEPGNYQFRFVPNGDSPKKLDIRLEGKNFHFSETFVLEGTLHQTGISEYFTWDYQGNKMISVSEEQDVKIIINPNGNLMGPVSVSIIEK